MPAWSAAWEKVAHDSVMSSQGTAPGSTLELPARSVVEAPKSSLWVKRLRISARRSDSDDDSRAGAARSRELRRTAQGGHVNENRKVRHFRYLKRAPPESHEPAHPAIPCTLRNQSPV